MIYRYPEKHTQSKGMNVKDLSQNKTRNKKKRNTNKTHPYLKLTKTHPNTSNGFSVDAQADGRFRGLEQ